MAKLHHTLMLKQQIIWLVSTAFGIAAALFWKDTITEVIKVYIPSSQSLAFSLYASIIVTIIAFLAIWVTHEILKE